MNGNPKTVRLLTILSCGIRRGVEHLSEEPRESRSSCLRRDDIAREKEENGRLDRRGTWAVKVICGDVGYGSEDHPGSPYDALSDHSSIGPNIQNQTLGDLEDEDFASQISRGGWPVKDLRSRHQ